MEWGNDPCPLPVFSEWMDFLPAGPTDRNRRLFSIMKEPYVKIHPEWQDGTGPAHNHWPDRPVIMKKIFYRVFLWMVTSSHTTNNSMMTRLQVPAPEEFVTG